MEPETETETKTKIKRAGGELPLSGQDASFLTKWGAVETTSLTKWLFPWLYAAIVNHNRQTHPIRRP